MPAERWRVPPAAGDDVVVAVGAHGVLKAGRVVVVRVRGGRRGALAGRAAARAA
jgi:hypothetical protein